MSDTDKGTVRLGDQVTAKALAGEGEDRLRAADIIAFGGSAAPAGP
jgi:hypothetical protein